MYHCAADVLRVHDLLHYVGVPRGGLCWVLMSGISAVLKLIGIKITAEAKMSETLGVLRCDNLGVTLAVVDVLPRRECRTHGSAY